MTRPCRIGLLLALALACAAQALGQTDAAPIKPAEQAQPWYWALSHDVLAAFPSTIPAVVAVLVAYWLGLRRSKREARQRRENRARTIRGALSIELKTNLSVIDTPVQPNDAVPFCAKVEHDLSLEVYSACLLDIGDIMGDDAELTYGAYDQIKRLRNTAGRIMGKALHTHADVRTRLKVPPPTAVEAQKNAVARSITAALGTMRESREDKSLRDSSK